LRVALVIDVEVEVAPWQREDEVRVLHRGFLPVQDLRSARKEGRKEGREGGREGGQTCGRRDKHQVSEEPRKLLATPVPLKSGTPFRISPCIDPSTCPST
jgi:hypothetical protein